LAERLSTWQLPVELPSATQPPWVNYWCRQGKQNLLYLTVSTGIGAGIIIQRQLYRGERAGRARSGICRCSRAGRFAVRSQRLPEALVPGAPSPGASRLTHRRTLQPGWSMPVNWLRRPRPAMRWRGSLAQAMHWLGIGIASGPACSI
jgi:hypothetical protein